MKIGLIQTQKLGDIVIALPIAAWYAKLGHEVFWPINELYLDIFTDAAPYVRFLPLSAVPGQAMEDHFYLAPKKILTNLGCDKIFNLDINFAHADPVTHKSAASLKFDEHKYAVAHVPFEQKWHLTMIRDEAREMRLRRITKLDDDRPYICLHRTGPDKACTIDLPQAWRDQYRIVEIETVTPNPLDWLYIAEKAEKRIMIDSLFANLVEQMNFPGDNYLVLRSPTRLTPVYRNRWTFLHPSFASAEGQPQPHLT